MMGTPTPRPNRIGFSTLSINATMTHQIRKMTALRGAGDRKRVNHSRDEYKDSDLKHGCEEEDDGPQTCAGQALYRKTYPGKNCLDERNSKDTDSDTADGGSDKFVELGTSFAKQPIRK